MSQAGLHSENQVCHRKRTWKLDSFDGLGFAYLSGILSMARVTQNDLERQHSNGRKSVLILGSMRYAKDLML